MPDFNFWKPDSAARFCGALNYRQRDPPDTFVNIAEQYHPCGLAHEFPQFDRQITADEYGQALALADKVAHPQDGLATGED